MTKLGFWIARLICLFRGHQWFATWSANPDPKDLGGYLEIYCKRCLDGVALSFEAPISKGADRIDWWIFKDGIRIPMPRKGKESHV